RKLPLRSAFPTLDTSTTCSNGTMIARPSNSGIGIRSRFPGSLSEVDAHRQPALHDQGRPPATNGSCLRLHHLAYLPVRSPCNLSSPYAVYYGKKTQGGLTDETK